MIIKLIMSVWSLTSVFLFITIASESELCLTRPVGECLHCRARSHSDIKYKLFTRANTQRHQIIPVGSNVTLRRSNFDLSHPTVIYVPGFTESTTGDSTTALKNAYLDKGNHNFIAVDWSALVVYPWYISAVRNTHYMGKQLANFVEFLYNEGVRGSNLHVIGFSLGAEAAGFAGKELNKRGSTLARITGLDPAYPLFKWFTTEDHLSRGDALFVDVVHTNPGWFGVSVAIGDVDFYANPENWFQPGCRLDQLVMSNVPFDKYVSCSHNRAWKFYAESVGNPKGFPATKCRYWENSCWSKDGYMGYAATSTISGKMYLKTNSKPPYARNGP